ncbi:uncharacterized protein DNG_05180 [Cephalotrichum gorgonifer]|uniref:Thaumatin-like protein n=1 Tax=Cephalotrichum gorgonifer TaxID=2041049 RepID=A0AAE8SW18_9PEZI|nr:uncharacterized protein DNG_05180 [Cephalotrichum gorgonifer]
MKSTQLASITGLCLSAGGVFAAPQIFTPCFKESRYKDIVVSAPYNLPAQMATGRSCTSLATETCEVDVGVSHTVTVQQTVSGAFAGALDLGKIFNLGLEAGYSYSWSTSDETSASATVICPEGNYYCGMMVTPVVVKITGQVTQQGGCNVVDETKYYPFEIVAPYLEGDDGQAENIRAAMQFSVCMYTCNGADSCNHALQIGLPWCPSDRTFDHGGEGNFGGQIGYIPIDQAGGQ